MHKPRGLRYSGAAALILLTSIAADAQKVAMAATFRTSARMVLVPVTVTDNYGRTILGLRAQDFNIFDDQSPQRIASFTSEDVPCSVGLVVDVSGSMKNALGMAKDGAQAFVKAANPEDEFLLMTVSTTPGDRFGFTSDAADVVRTIGAARTGGMTPLIDAVYSGLNQMRKASHPQRALVILSDGMDNHSQYTRNQLLRVALEADVQIYTIILPTTGSSAASTVPFRPSMIKKPGDQGADLQGPELLEKLADKTGGLHFHAKNEAEAKEAIAKVGQALRNEYVIGFQPADSGVSGKAHRIRVTTAGPKVYVHARSSYFAPSGK